MSVSKTKNRAHCAPGVIPPLGGSIHSPVGTHPTFARSNQRTKQGAGVIPAEARAGINRFSGFISSSATYADLYPVVVPQTFAPVAPEIHVLIGSVPWRRASLNRLLREVAAQALLPAFVHLVLDGEGTPNAALDLSPIAWGGVRVDVRVQRPSRGAGSRWHVVDEMPENHIVCNLDDDVGLHPNYLALHRAALQKSEAVCSGGYTVSGALLMCNRTDDPYEGEITCLQAGAFSARVKHLRGLRDMPLANEMLGVLGDDEGLIAAHLWKKGVPVKRVHAPVGFDASACDPRSQFIAGGTRILGLRTRLKAATGWPWEER
jgi:hypothetical protein